MKKFRLTLPEVFEMMKKSIVVDVKEKEWQDGTQLYYIRKRNLEINPEFGQLFGYNMETIKQLTKKQFELFIEHKEEFERIVQE